MMKNTWHILFLFLPIFSVCTFIYGAEEILDYHSRVEIQPDGTLYVAETIEIQALGESIRHGIFRSFPVVYRDRYNNTMRVGFEVVEITKGGKPEPFEVIRQGDYKVIRIGSEQVLLEPGIYVYEIKYQTNHQIGFFEDFDELYWNAIGGEWPFVIQNASTRVKLPPGAEVMQIDAYSGPIGSTDCDCEVTQEADDLVYVAMNKGLQPKEYLTVAVSWQKGLVTRPDKKQAVERFFSDNQDVMTLLVGFLLVLTYYCFAWRKVGRDPAKGGIYPRFEAPEGMDAPACRYLFKMGFDATVFSTAIIQMAIKQLLRIVEEKRGRYVLQRLSHEEVQPDEIESKMLSALFPHNSNVLELKKKEHQKISAAQTVLQQDLKSRYNKKYFRNNHVWLLPGIGLSLVSLLLALNITFEQLFEEEKVFLIIGLFFAFVCILYLQRVFVTLLEYLDTGFIQTKTIAIAIFGAIFLLSFVGFVVYSFNIKLPYLFLSLVILLGLVNVVFYYLLKAPTKKGREAMDAIEGFRMYLNAAEKPLIQQYNPPGMTPEIFEKYLPHAIALGVGTAWGKGLEYRLAMLYGQEDSRDRYLPSWYSGRAFEVASLGAFSQDLGQSFGSALSNSANPPGSKSGSGGGGRSGGGGGGGGGGGW
ncbi:DUF2207 domain-containing protein [Negadavirga shengliensis]|uniref:DUF2207 domain-containing protein n=1 Tax=Negadavirga shengliensis TaxID=1389218 RepID=A0ABV9SWW9_9BACT